MYLGDCVEFDTDSLSANKDDILITHLPTNIKKITLRSVLKIIGDSLKHKKEENIISGPIILTFDNKKLSTPETHNIFWKIINEELIEKYPGIIAKIDEKFDLSKITIDSLSNKILLRWGENKKCNTDLNLLETVGKEVCPPPKNIKDKFTTIATSWMHIKKGHIKFSKNIVKDRNLSVSISVPFINKVTEPNINIINNTQRNIMRIYPHFSSTQSENYDNIKFFREGVQIVAINLQKITDPWYLNKAIFLPNVGVPCTPVTTFNKTCKNSWKNTLNDSKPLAYRLKPLWLIGLIPHPGYYNLEIELVKVEQLENNIFIDISKEYNNIEMTEGVYNKKMSASKLNNKMIFKDIDVSVPFFVIQLKKSSNISFSSYKSGVEIPWSIQNLSNNIQVDLYKIVKTTVGSYNKVDLEKNQDDDCNNSFLFNIRKQIRATLKYKWIKSNNIKSLEKYNDTITKLRTKFNKPTIDFLSNLLLCSRINKIPLLKS